MTEYIECSNIKTLSEVAIPIAPPEPPSPIIIEIVGILVFKIEAIDSD